MSIFAGVISRISDFSVTEKMCHEIRNNISRNDINIVKEFKTKTSYLAKIDFGAFGSSGICKGFDNSISMITGEPLLQFSDVDAGRERYEDLKLLHEEWKRSKYDLMRTSRGTYNAVFYDAVSNTVLLMADKLGVRSLYYWISPEYIVFSSALRILENLSFVPIELDFTGMTEALTFGQPLAQRTQYSDIFTLQAGELVKITPEKVEKSFYWSWDKVPLSNCSTEEALQKVYTDFSTAIKFRLRNQKTTVAFLSGGLDSRVIVGSLCGQDITVHTLNFAPQGAQDQVFGKEFAEAIGTLHQEVFVDSIHNIDRRRAAADIWGKSEALKEIPPEKPRLVWSGDGGSVGLGHVYLNHSIIDLAAESKLDAAIEGLIKYNKWQFPGTGILQKEFSKKVANAPFDGIKTEISGLNTEEPGRAFYLFLMLNDQRRHLAEHFEDIDLYRMEFQLPFFDSIFLETICSIPVTEFLRHKFYVDWLNLFPAAVTSVPWQAYPGHVPCPLPIPAELRYQWDNYFDETVTTEMAIEQVNRVTNLLKSKKFPSHIFSRNKLRLALFLTRTGIRDYRYLLNLFENFFSAYEKTH